jgi:transposase
MPLSRLKIVNRAPSQSKSTDWVNLERSLDAQNFDWQYGEILGLEGLKTIKFKEANTDIFILAETSDKTECPCGSTPLVLRKHGWTSPIMVLDSPIRHKRTSVYFRSQRFKCEKCRRVVQQTAAAVHKRHRLTNRLVDYIEKASLNISKIFSEIAFETGVHEKIIRNIFTNHVERLEKNRQIITPRWIAIDEVFPATRKSVRCVITAPEPRDVVDILENNSHKTLGKWLLQLPERSKVEVVSIDMYKPYRLIVSTILKNTKIVVDRYHVDNMLNNNLKEVHQVIRASLTAKKQDEHPVSEHLLLKSRFHLSSEKHKSKQKVLSERERINSWFTEFPHLARAYTLKEDFSDILQLSDKKLAEIRADVWLEQVALFYEDFVEKFKGECKTLRKYPFRSVLKTMKFWMPCILNYIDFKDKFDIKVTNAFAEFANKQIKRAYNKANSCSFYVLRAKVVFGNFLKDTLPPHPLRIKKHYGVRRLRKKTKTPLPNPKANLFILKNAYDDSDKTKDLLPKPQENPAWNVRFGGYKEITHPEEIIYLSSGTEELSLLSDKKTSDLRSKKNKKKSRGKNDPDQLSLFSDY